VATRIRTHRPVEHLHYIMSSHFSLPQSEKGVKSQTAPAIRSEKACVHLRASASPSKTRQKIEAQPMKAMEVEKSGNYAILLPTIFTPSPKN